MGLAALVAAFSRYSSNSRNSRFLDLLEYLELTTFDGAFGARRLHRAGKFVIIRAIMSNQAYKPCEKAPKPPKTLEDLEAIAYLETLRKGEGESKPADLPLACRVLVIDEQNVPKANDAYKMVTVETKGAKRFRLCLSRTLPTPGGEEMLFVNECAALPIEERWKNPLAAQIKEKVYKFGFGIKVRRLKLHIKRNIYIHNCGALYPLEAFAEDVASTSLGEECGHLLNIDDAEDLKARQNMKMAKLPEEELTPQPSPWVVKSRAALAKREQEKAKASRIEKKKRLAAKEAEERNAPSFNFLHQIRGFRRNGKKMK